MSLLLLLGSAGGGTPAPTYITWNPADKAADYTLSDGDLTVTKSGVNSWVSLRALLGVQTGIVQVQFGAAYTTTPNCIVGVGTASASLATYVGGDSHGYGYNLNSGTLYHNGSGTPNGAAFAIGQVVDAVFDLDLKTVAILRDGAPAGGFSYAALSGDVYAMLAIYDPSGSMASDFGQNGFTYPVVGATGWQQP